MAEFTRQEELENKENCSKAVSDIRDSGDESIIVYRVFHITLRGRGIPPIPLGGYDKFDWGKFFYWVVWI